MFVSVNDHSPFPAITFEAMTIQLAAAGLVAIHKRFALLAVLDKVREKLPLAGANEKLKNFGWPVTLCTVSSAGLLVAAPKVLVTTTE